MVTHVCPGGDSVSLGAQRAGAHVVFSTSPRTRAPRAWVVATERSTKVAQGHTSQPACPLNSLAHFQARQVVGGVKYSVQAFCKHFASRCCRQGSPPFPSASWSSPISVPIPLSQGNTRFPLSHRSSSRSLLLLSRRNARLRCLFRLRSGNPTSTYLCFLAAADSLLSAAVGLISSQTLWISAIRRFTDRVASTPTLMSPAARAALIALTAASW